jgi:hypothetical protein
MKLCEQFAKEYIFAFENHLITNTTNQDQTKYLFDYATVITDQINNQIVMNDAKGAK